MLVKIQDLRLGDVIRVYDTDAYGDGTVINITDKDVIVFRPYTHHSDFAYTGGIIPYLGMGSIQYSLSSEMKFKVWRRADHIR